ncbi:MAG: metallophosphoesterase [Nitrospira sp.]|nr:metallophosphoesterase [Nitrospira sp.]
MRRRYGSWRERIQANIGYSVGHWPYRMFGRAPSLEYGLSSHTVSKLTCSDEGLAGRRAVHLSDLHIDWYHSRHDGVINAVAEQRPDWIFVTGDLLNLPEGLSHLYRFLAGLRTIAPVYIVLGNHDHYSGVPVSQFIELSEAHHLTLLINQHVIVQTDSGELAIAGVDDPSLDRADLRCVPPAAHRRFTLLLAHAPNILDQMESHHEVDLILCGHSHGGQWRIPGIPTFWLPPGCNGRVAGEHRSGEHTLYVNRGMGWSLLPFRLNCDPEIVVIDWVDDQQDEDSA